MTPGVECFACCIVGIAFGVIITIVALDAYREMKDKKEFERQKLKGEMKLIAMEVLGVYLDSRIAKHEKKNKEQK